MREGYFYISKIFTPIWLLSKHFGPWVHECQSKSCRGKNGAVLIPSIRGRHLLCWQQMWHWAAVRSWKINSMQISICLILSRLPQRGLSPLTLRQCFTFIAQFLDGGWVLSAVWLICAVALLCLVLWLWLQIWQIGDRQRFYGKFPDLISVSP